MSSLALELFVGPAVVVDDEVNEPGTVACTIVEELKKAHFPVIRRRDIPPDDQIAHWQAMSLIVLDWDLLGTITISSNDEDSDDIDDGSATLLGVALPNRLKEDPRTDSLRFVRKLMNDLYCPIFIVSNLDVKKIWEELESGLDEDNIHDLKARVLVRSKTQAVDSLLEGLSKWIANHPAIYALKTWERGYERAKATLFNDFQQSAVEWPGILWKTSREDGTNPNHDLTETIYRNLLHRMDPHLFSAEIISSHTRSGSLDSVRRVLHQQAVLPVERLHDDVIMPGDFFIGEDEDHEPPQRIYICLTPACDLVARGESSDEIRMYMVTAALVRDDELSTPRAIKHKLGLNDSTTSFPLHHLVPEDAMYVVRFKNWFITTWGEAKNYRLGRLLDPYVTLLQQRNALFSQRQGLPRLPDSFYRPPPAAT